MLKINELQKAIEKAGKETIMGLYNHMNYSEKEDINILLNRENKCCSADNIKEILTNKENTSLLYDIYKYAEEAEKRDLEILSK